MSIAISPELKQQLHSRAAEQGMTMQQYVVSRVVSAFSHDWDSDGDNIYDTLYVR